MLKPKGSNGAEAQPSAGDTARLEALLTRARELHEDVDFKAGRAW